MKIYYLQSSNRIVAAKYDVEISNFDVSTIAPFNTLYIDENELIHRSVCADLMKTLGKVDEFGDNKYFVISDILVIKDGWKEMVNVI